MIYQLDNLSDADKEIFTDRFYCGVDFDDTDSPLPWGCPWLWQKTGLEADTIKELCEEYLASIAESLLDLDVAL